MGDSKHHLPLEPPIPPLTLSSPNLIAVLTQMIWWDELITMNLPSPHNLASHQLGPPFHTVLDKSGRNLHILAYTGDTTIPDSHCADAIIHALTCLIQESHESSTLKSISIPFGPSFVRTSLHPNLLSALPPLGFSQGKPTTISALATRAYQKKQRQLPSSLRLREVTTPEELSHKIAIESGVFEYPSSYINALGLALEYMTYGTAQARDHHYLAWFTPDSSADEGVKTELPVAYFTLRVGRGVAYVQGAGVLEPWRRHGITRAMLDHAIDVAVQLGYEVIGNSAWTDDAAAAWRAMGFEDVGEFTEWKWENNMTAGTAAMGS
ncbi:hypothetical protein M758_7G145200 [Ceratodon purpureus]|nr:hypothetical protein M758_7G145200 [Ceratodon purpureus]